MSADGVREQIEREARVAGEEQREVSLRLGRSAARAEEAADEARRVHMAAATRGVAQAAAERYHDSQAERLKRADGGLLRVGEEGGNDTSG